MNDPVTRPPAVSLKGVHKTYPGADRVQAVRGVDLDVAEGEMVAIMGKSGSGKSTLLNLIGTLDRPDRGAILFHGRDIRGVSGLARFRREEIGFVFQLHCLLPHLTLLDNVALPIQGVAGANALAHEALKRVGLADRARHTPVTVSGGERQRAAIARAIVNKPKVLLADEPTGNVDSENEAIILHLFDELRQSLGMTLIVVTHERSVAERADRIVHFKDGAIEHIEVPGSART
ncbi:MAG: ABC transporter ATP-binding protein [Planctomycetes bacterium]|nr:ABC transporter ATP-binding protein [Planctomycetota bacterium]